jgi:hypothetical protein
MRTYRLTNETEGLGLSCTAAGLSLAGTPLLCRMGSGFAPRPAAEIGLLMRAAYGADGGANRLETSLQAIARALNGGELARAAIAAVLTRTPELSPDAARRLAAANDDLTKYDPDQPRDWHGRWTSDGGAGPAPARQGATRQPANSTGVHVADPAAMPARPAADLGGSPTPDASATTANGTAENEPRGLTDLEQRFESQYDDLGPVEFAKQVLQFGDHLARGGANLPPAEKDQTLSEYAFLEDRISFWLAYEYTPPTAQGNLLCAAQALFQGAMLSGIAQPGHLPKSMLNVAADVWANDNPPLRPRFPADPVVEIAPEARAALEAPLAVPKDIEGLGGIVDNSKIGIVWGKAIADQGDPFEAYVEAELPEANGLPATAKTFDQFDRATGTAISDKTLNTLSISYVRDPQRIYWRLKQYVDAAADYEPWAKFDVDPSQIETKMIQLAIPEYTSTTQWRYIFWALDYGGKRGVSISITRIRE